MSSHTCQSEAKYGREQTLVHLKWAEELLCECAQVVCPHPNMLHLSPFVFLLLVHLVCVVLVLGLNCKEFQPSSCLFIKHYLIFWKETLSHSRAYWSVSGVLASSKQNKCTSNKWISVNNHAIHKQKNFCFFRSLERMRNSSPMQKSKSLDFVALTAASDHIW